MQGGPSSVVKDRAGARGKSRPTHPRRQNRTHQPMPKIPALTSRTSVRVASAIGIPMAYRIAVSA